MPECFYCENNVEDIAFAMLRDGKKEIQIQVCSDCQEDFCFMCNGCDTLYDVDSRSILRAGVDNSNRLAYCVSCRNSKTFRCETCNNLHHDTNKHRLVMYYVNERVEIAIEGAPPRHVCKPCYKGNYRRCQHCDSDTLSGQLYADGAGRRICVRCRDAATVIKRYSAQPTDYMPFRGDKRADGKPTMYMGVELEVTLKDPKNQPPRELIAQQILPLVGDFSILTLDRSVPNGWEIKTTPATYEYHMRAWEPFFTYIEQQDHLLQERGQNCGLHVHLSRAAMTSLQIGRFICFINDPNNRDFMRKIAERDTHFAAYRDGIRAVHDWKCLNHVENHYQAVNITKPATVEVRIFASMLKRENFYKNLEFLQALLDYTAPLSCGDFKDYRRFEDYVAKREKDFPHLYTFLNPPKPVKPIRKKVRKAQKAAVPRFLDTIQDDELEAVAQWIGVSPHKVVVNQQ